MSCGNCGVSTAHHRSPMVGGSNNHRTGETYHHLLSVIHIITARPDSIYVKDREKDFSIIFLASGSAIWMRSLGSTRGGTKDCQTGCNLCMIGPIIAFDS
jgi:hypothetical protein